MRITLFDSDCPELEPWLIGYLGGEIAGPEGVERRLLPARPNCFVQIVLEGQLVLKGHADRTCVNAPVAGLFGLLSQYSYDMEVPAAMRSVSARLQPAAAGVLFGVDPVALVDSFVALDLPEDLLAQLQAAPDWQAMVAPLNGWLLGLAHDRRSDDPVAIQASRLRQLNGNIAIQDLADAAGFSLRHFQRRFRALTGVNPKHYARICRIGHAVYRKQLQPDASWTTLAHDAGYSDQPHFIRDFKALTGTLPRDFLRGQSPMARYPKWDE